MELFIQVRSGEALDHPITAENFQQAFPDVDVNNLPADFARFVRVERPTLGVYEVYEGVTYDRVGEAFMDVHHVRQMTDEEKLEKQNEMKAYWANINFASWIFNEATCEFDPPTPYPNDGKQYRWDEPTTSWIEVAQG